MYLGEPRDFQEVQDFYQLQRGVLGTAQCPDEAWLLCLVTVDQTQAVYKIAEWMSILGRSHVSDGLTQMQRELLEPVRRACLDGPEQTCALSVSLFLLSESAAD